jgi:hypothetical protein
MSERMITIPYEEYKRLLNQNDELRDEIFNEHKEHIDLLYKRLRWSKDSEIESLQKIRDLRLEIERINNRGILKRIFRI